MHRLTPSTVLLLVVTLLFALLGARPALASGPVVGWGWDYSGQALPPPKVDGTTGTASAISSGTSHSCAIQAGTGRFRHQGEI